MSLSRSICYTLGMRHLSFLSFVPANDTAAGANFFLSLQQSELPPSVLAAAGLPLCLSLLSFISLKVARYGRGGEIN